MNVLADKSDSYDIRYKDIAMRDWHWSFTDWDG